MMTNREIRQFAWRQLKGNWFAAIGASLLSTICLMALVLLMAGGYLLAFLGAAAAMSRTGAADIRYVLPVTGVVMAALLFLLIYIASGFSLGALRLNLRIARGERVRARDIFAGFTDFLQLRHFACVYILMNVGAWVLNLPMDIVSAIYGGSSANAHITALICNALAIVYAFFMSMATLAAAENRNRGALKSIRVSCHIMRCRKLRLLGLYLSFIPWIALSMLSFGIGYLFAIPYLSVAQAIFFLSAYSEDYLTSAQDADFREVSEDNVGGSNTAAAAEDEGDARDATAVWENTEPAANAAGNAEMSERDMSPAENKTEAEPAASELPTLDRDEAAQETVAVESDARAAAESKEKTEQRRSFEEVYREVVLQNGGKAEADSREEGGTS